MAQMFIMNAPVVVVQPEEDEDNEAAGVRGHTLATARPCGMSIGFKFTMYGWEHPQASHDTMTQCHICLNRFVNLVSSTAAH